MIVQTADVEGLMEGRNTQGGQQSAQRLSKEWTPVNYLRDFEGLFTHIWHLWHRVAPGTYLIKDHLTTTSLHCRPSPLRSTTMPALSPAQSLLMKAEKRSGSSAGWFSSSTTKYEEAGDLYQQAANAFKLDKLFREAGDSFAKEAECREKCNETNEAANAWWNAAKSYKQGYPDRVSIFSVFRPFPSHRDV